MLVWLYVVQVVMKYLTPGPNLPILCTTQVSDQTEDIRLYIDIERYR